MFIGAALAKTLDSVSGFKNVKEKIYLHPMLEKDIQFDILEGMHTTRTVSSAIMIVVTYVIHF